MRLAGREHRHHCPVCNGPASRSIAALHYLMWRDLGMDGSAELVACDDCGMVFNAPHDPEQAFDRYYAGHDYYAVTDTAGAGALNEHEGRRYRRTYEAFRPYLDVTPPFIVDVGAGQGGFLRWCRGEVGASVAAVEPSDACRAAMRERGIPAHEDLPTVAGQPDIIVCSHVLEHLLHPLDMLRTITGHMTPDTLLYVEVPNAAHDLAAVDPWKRLYFEHINHFDAAHLQGLLHAAGLRSLSQGHTAFSPPAGEDGECLYAVCRKGPGAGKTLPPDTGLCALAEHALAAAPPLLRPGGRLAPPAGGIAVWGISQYAQLLLGQSPRLRNSITMLADASPAKQGRWLGDHRVEPPEALAALTEHTLMLIPEGMHAQTMRKRLGEMGCKGKIIEF